MVGVVLVKKQSAVGSAPEIYKVGCAGRITAFEETPSGAVIATITGYCRFDIEEELEGLRKYRTVKSNWTPYYDDLIIEVNPPLDRDRCAELLKKYAETLSIEMDWAVLNQVPNMSLINFFAMCLPFSRAQRQKLLEAQTLKDRGECLVKLLEDKLKAKKSRKKTD
jgi:Lon protease-like protein